jgi:hypothetical protein
VFRVEQVMKVSLVEKDNKVHKDYKATKVHKDHKVLVLKVLMDLDLRVLKVYKVLKEQ